VAVKMKVRKGDLVHMIKGKDRGKQGRVIDARPAERRVIVENLNVVKRHTKPRPMRDSSRMGGTQMTPGGVIEKAAPVPVDNVMVVCPTCNRPTRVGMQEKTVKDKHVYVRVCKRADCGQEIDK
jgi:large subunit ribosomal protein L24